MDCEIILETGQLACMARELQDICSIPQEHHLQGDLYNAQHYGSCLFHIWHVVYVAEVVLQFPRQFLQKISITHYYTNIIGKILLIRI